VADVPDVADVASGFTLALGAGGGRGWAHLGVARALEERGLRPNRIIGASIGAVVGAGLAAGLTPREIGAIAAKADVWRETRRRVHLSYFDVRPLLDRILAEIGDPRIEDLPIPFGATTRDLISGREEIITTGRVADALCRATAIPLVFAPQHDGEAVWVDAGWWEGVPVTAARSVSDDPVVGVEVLGTIYLPSRWPISRVLVLSGRLLTAGKPSRRLSARRYLGLLATRFAERPQFVEPDLLIRPNLGRANPMDFTLIEPLERIGYEEARRVLSHLPHATPTRRRRRSAAASA